MRLKIDFSASVLHSFCSTFSIFFLGTESNDLYKSKRRKDYLFYFDFFKLVYFILLKNFHNIYNRTVVRFEC